MSASYKKICSINIFAACPAISESFPRARSINTSIDGPPFICDSNVKANSGDISSNLNLPVIISFNSFAFSAAALVVPGNVL